MHKNKALLFILACLICALTLSACHVNNDPWPASSGTGGAAETAVEASDAPTNGAPADPAAPTDAPAVNDGAPSGYNG